MISEASIFIPEHIDCCIFCSCCLIFFIFWEAFFCDFFASSICSFCKFSMLSSRSCERLSCSIISCIFFISSNNSESSFLSIISAASFICSVKLSNLSQTFSCCSANFLLVSPFSSVFLFSLFCISSISSAISSAF